ncbi:MAG: epoxyqueuosine reductase [Candidatus Saccharibacteria bacterium]
MKDRDLKNKIKAIAMNLGADLVGIASVERFAGAPEGFHPTDIVPQAKTVVVLAKVFPKEVLINKRRLTAYKSAFDGLVSKLDSIALNLANYIEELGFKAYPVPTDDPYTSWDEETLHGRGDLSHRHAAVAAGLGVMGKNTLLITPQYGNRVYLTSIITNLDIEADPLLELNLCPEDCRICLDACPAGALDGQTVVQKLCRPQMSTKLPRGFSVYGCWECRRVCPVGNRSVY